MYLEHWGLEVFPYEIVPDLKFVYNSGHYREAMTRLMYAIMRRKGAALLTGDVGCGKTTLSRALIQNLSQKEYHVGLITNPMLEPIEFIREILYQFGLDPASHSKHDLLNTLGEMMMRTSGRARRRSSSSTRRSFSRRRTSRRCASCSTTSSTTGSC